MKANRVTISTEAYEFSHGKKPRGTSGGWMFCPANKWNGNDYLDHCWTALGAQTYASAARAAKNHFAGLGISSIVACS